MTNRGWIGAIGAVVLLGGLTACSGQASQTPDDVIRSYVDGLNAGDLASGLDLVDDPGDATAENTTKFDDVTIPDPKAVESEFDDGAEAVALEYRFDGTNRQVNFIIVDGTWKLEEPLFITPVAMNDSLASGEPNAFALLAENGTHPDPVEGVDVFAGEYTVMFGEREYEISADFDGTNEIEPITLTGSLTFDPAESGAGIVALVSHPHLDAAVTESLYEQIQQVARTTIESSVEEFGSASDIESPAIDTCSANFTSVAADEVDGSGFDVTCDPFSYTLTIDDDPNLAHAGEVTSENRSITVTVTNGSVTVD